MGKQHLCNQKCKLPPALCMLGQVPSVCTLLRWPWQVHSDFGRHGPEGPLPIPSVCLPQLSVEEKHLRMSLRSKKFSSSASVSRRSSQNPPACCKSKLKCKNMSCWVATGFVILGSQLCSVMICKNYLCEFRIRCKLGSGFMQTQVELNCVDT
jgi:hypothetical protein